MKNTDWQLIETAPHDGTRILVGGYRHFGDWLEFIAEYSSDGTWYSAGAVKIVPPTHWMPLPDPPGAG